MRISDWSSDVCSSDLCWADMPALIAGVQAIGDEIGLPFIAAQADLGDPEPMADRAGSPYAETSFRWIDPDYAYWRDRKLALHVAFLTAERLVAEPFFYSDGRLGSWRATGLLDAVDCQQAKDTPNRSEEQTAELQSLMRLSYAVFCL